MTKKDLDEDVSQLVSGSPAQASQQPYIRHVAVLGAGSWGTALAMAFARAGASVQLWGRNATHVRRMTVSRKNERYLGERILPSRIKPTCDLRPAAGQADAIFVATPSGAVRSILQSISPAVRPGTPVISCTKGLVPETNQLMCACVESEIPHCIPMMLSGPSFATEVADGAPTLVSIAGAVSIAEALARDLSSATFQLQPESDLIGAQVGGLLKNVIAIACGVSDGLDMGANTRAAIISRGLQEAAALTEILGGTSKTLLGASGAGDFALTCTDAKSRNYSLGRSLADPAFSLTSQTFEGAASVKNICKLVQKHGLNASISQAVNKLLEGNLTPRKMISAALWDTSDTMTTRQIA